MCKLLHPCQSQSVIYQKFLFICCNAFAKAINMLDGFNLFLVKFSVQYLCFICAEHHTNLQCSCAFILLYNIHNVLHKLIIR